VPSGDAHLLESRSRARNRTLASDLNVTVHFSLLGRDFAAPEIIGDFPAPEGELSVNQAFRNSQRTPFIFAVLGKPARHEKHK